MCRRHWRKNTEMRQGFVWANSHHVYQASFHLISFASLLLFLQHSCNGHCKLTFQKAPGRTETIENPFCFIIILIISGFPLLLPPRLSFYIQFWFLWGSGKVISCTFCVTVMHVLSMSYA